MYYVVYSFLYVLSLLPLKILYLISDFAYLFVYYVFGYRKKVVLYNLSVAFPQKTEKERIIIARKFYRNFSDTLIETIKLFSAGEQFIKKHFSANYSALDVPWRQGKKCQLHLGHNFNWELAMLNVSLIAKQKVLAVYMPLNNKLFDRIFKKLRTKTGGILLPATDMRNSLLPWRNQPYVLGLVADQNPANPNKAYWINFFGRPTPFVKGPENGARAGNLTVIFCKITKKKRGYYEAVAEIEEENPAALPEGELTKRYARYLEKVIGESPEMWLWSHRRWKYEWKPEYGPVIQ